MKGEIKMPNIEIHGLPWSKAHDIRLKIFFAFKDEHYVNEMVVTVFRTEVHDIAGEEQPFLRLVNSCQEHSGEIIEKLKTFNMDIEHAQLEDFYPRGRTVNDFRKHLFKKFGCDDYFVFIAKSYKHSEFWRKLNKIGARNIGKLPPTEVPDIDATVILSDQEWNDLGKELEQLLKA